MFIKLTDGTIINSDKITSISIFDMEKRNLGFETTCMSIRFGSDSGIIINSSEEAINDDYERLSTLLCAIKK